MSEVLNKIEDSFKLAMSGKEDLRVMIRYWALPMYIIAYFVDKMILKIDSRIFDVTASLLMIIYFSWHIYAMKKCSPKKPKLTKEEKERLKIERRKTRGKKLMRKLLLQESITEWNPLMITNVIDLCFITTFLAYL